jgi:hypothetical protein
VPDGSSGRAVKAELAAELKNASHREVAACKERAGFCGIRKRTNTLSFSLRNGPLRAAESAVFFRAKNLEKSRSDNMLQVTK